MKKLLVPFIVAIAFAIIGMAIVTTAPANAAPTTTTTFLCNRTSVQITSPLVDVNNVATVSFKILNGCHFRLGIATYKSPGPNYDPNTVDQEQLFDHVAGTFSDDGAVHSLTVNVPNCFYQVDFFAWDLIAHFTTTNQYLGNLIAHLNAGTTGCDVPKPPDDTVGALPTTTTTFEMNGTPPNPDGPPLVVKPASSVTPHAQLAVTGVSIWPAVILGSGLLISGLLLLGESHKKRIAQLQADATITWKHLRD